MTQQTNDTPTDRDTPRFCGAAISSVIGNDQSMISIKTLLIRISWWVGEAYNFHQPRYKERLVLLLLEMIPEFIDSLSTLRLDLGCVGVPNIPGIAMNLLVCCTVYVVHVHVL
jgi:hypothetical protein